MKLSSFSAAVLALAAVALFPAATAVAQPSFLAPPPATAPVQDPDARRAAYFARIDEMLAYRTAPTSKLTFDMAGIATKLMRHEDLAACSQRVLELMADPGTGPFWMFPAVAVAFSDHDQLTPEARAALRTAWRTTRQLRGDTENHWAMYYGSLYLMSELYPDEPAASWSTGKSSAESLAESRDYLIHWMDLMTTVGQGEFNPTGYITEYAIPLLYLATWAKDPAMRQRGRMTLDWLFADLAQNTLAGVIRGAHARTTEGPVMERWNDHASFYSWLLFGNTPPPANYGGFGYYFALAAKNYELPEVIYRIATDRAADFTSHDLKRTRRRWRFSDALFAPIYKTSYMRRDYVVGGYQGGVADPIQTHVWDVTWAVPDPRGAHNTMFALHPHSSGEVMQMYFTSYLEPMPRGIFAEGKPSYDEPDKILGCSPYEQVFQDLDTVVALYAIPPGTRFPLINGFFSRDLVNLTEDPSGWIFAQGGATYLAYRPLAPYTWLPLQGYKQVPPPAGQSYDYVRVPTRDKLLQSPHLNNGAIVQAASASEFKDFAAFKAAINALPLEFKLEPVPTLKLTTLRGKKVTCTYGAAPIINGTKLDYSKWKLFESPYLNAEAGSRRLTITHGRLQRVLDFNTLTIADSVK